MRFMEFNPKKKEVEKLTEGNTDCVIRAIMLAMNTTRSMEQASTGKDKLFVTWEEAYDIACAKGREIYAMPDTFDTLDAVLTDMGYKYIEYDGTAASVADKYPIGCMILDMPLHNSVIVNGVMHDAEDCGRRKLLGYWDNAKERARLEEIHKDDAPEEPKARRRGTKKPKVYKKACVLEREPWRGVQA